MSEEPQGSGTAGSYGRFARVEVPPPGREIPRGVIRAVAVTVALVLVGGLVWGVLAWWRGGQLPAGHEAWDASYLTVGDCLMLPEGSSEFYEVETVPCEEPHDAQVYALVAVREEDSLTTAGLQQRAVTGCRAKAAKARRLAGGTSYTTTYFTPTVHSVSGDGPEYVECLLEPLPAAGPQA